MKRLRYWWHKRKTIYPWYIRLMVYEAVLSMVRTSRNFRGLCAFFDDYSPVTSIYSNDGLAKFPEIEFLEPYHRGHAYWFKLDENGEQQRIKLLEKAIEMAKK